MWRQCKVGKAVVGQMSLQKYFLCKVAMGFMKDCGFYSLCDSFYYQAYKHESLFFMTFTSSICQWVLFFFFFTSVTSFWFWQHPQFPHFIKIFLQKHHWLITLYLGFDVPQYRMDLSLLLVFSHIIGSNRQLGVSVKTLLAMFEQQGRFKGSSCKAQSTWSPLISSVLWSFVFISKYWVSIILLGVVLP